MNTKGAALLRCIGDETRFAILRGMGDGAYSVGEITGMVKKDQPLVSHHLRMLKECGIVASSPQGRRSMYHISSPELVSLVRDIAGAAEKMHSLCAGDVRAGP